MSDDEQDGSQYIKMQPAVSSSPLRSETSGRSKQQLSGDQEDLEREKRSQRNRGEEEHAVGSIPVEHLNLDFEECFNEHKSTRTFLQLHTFLSLTYKYTKIVIYHILVIIVGIWFAIAWAVINAAVAFFHAWVYGPMLKLMLIIVYMLNPLYSVPVRVLLRPPVDTIGRLCRCEDKVTNTRCNI